MNDFLKAIEAGITKKPNQESYLPLNRRPDGTVKGEGFLGVLKLPDGNIATEYTMQSNAVKVNGKQIDFPTLVPTLTPSEVKTMVMDIIPNKKPIPDSIAQKAVDHAIMRLGGKQSVFADKPTIDKLK
jgi:hypothetical protein